MPHAALFQAKTLLPSSGNIGMRLNARRNALTETPTAASVCISGKESPIARKASARKRFTSGPAKEIFPFCSVFTRFPKIYTAPGAAKMNPPSVTNAMNSAANNPVVQARYSACAPYFMATYLCPSACSTKPAPRVSRISEKRSKENEPTGKSVNANAMVITEMAMWTASILPMEKFLDSIFMASEFDSFGFDELYCGGGEYSCIAQNDALAFQAVGKADFNPASDLPFLQRCRGNGVVQKQVLAVLVDLPLHEREYPVAFLHAAQCRLGVAREQCKAPA